MRGNYQDKVERVSGGLLRVRSTEAGKAAISQASKTHGRMD